jgi:hypothetical protein
MSSHHYGQEFKSLTTRTYRCQKKRDEEEGKEDTENETYKELKGKGKIT